MNLLQDFKNKPFIEAVQSFFENLNVPVNEIITVPATAIDIIGENPVNATINEVYVYGIVDDAIFEQNETFKNLAEVKSLKADYDGILLFGITLHPRENNLLPTRAQLADITRAFSRTFKHTPITIVFKYGNHIAFANSERMQFKQQWREGEKIGKVSLLRDIDFINLHSGHERILNNLSISRSGKYAVNNFESLYKYWQDVLSVSILNKAFYNELSNWYFWAIKEVQFPNEPNQIVLALNDDAYAEALKEHKGKNVIRLLTRILFIWFIKEKGLIPEDIFDEKTIANKFIDGFTPQKPEGIFANGKHSSKYYRAILQNLFFATLNQQQGKREFRSEGKHLNATQLMRYKSYLKNPDEFIQLMEDKVPFMNGGLFECLDKPHQTAKGSKGGDLIIYTDGFSDREDNNLVVPDFLFFDADEEIDLSNEYGNAKAKNSKTRGLIAILKSYKFTITENTPIDEDVALDPELLGKVFENLLASYNPETKTTARKQTGSFYTPREVVNYMVEESLITYLKNELLNEDAGIVELGKTQIALFGNETKKSQLSLEQKIDESPFKGKEEELDVKLRLLVSYNDINPFAEMAETHKKIIKALDNCKILDPACGSGAYPMGVLQKIVHILHKIDPKNIEWKQRQIDRVNRAIDELEFLDDVDAKEKSIQDLNNQIKDIEASFENNELDYGRKLYLIENCIYGVDIQPIATQISKLRFFISLVVDQKVDNTKDNFGIRPLPNLETKFVASNTLIGINKPKKGQFTGSLFDKNDVKKLEKELKKVRHKIFSIKTPSRKRELREEDKVIREQISDLLKEEYGNETALLLAQWDPYDQNTTATFFDQEWMFDITDGFDIVIGNPPYIQLQKDGGKLAKLYEKLKYSTFERTGDIYSLFYEKGIQLLNEKGVLCYITSNKWMRANYGASTREFFAEKTIPLLLIDFANLQVFETATVDTNILMLQNKPKNKIKEHTELFASRINNEFNLNKHSLNDFVKENGYFMTSLNHNAWIVGEKDTYNIKEFVENQGVPLFDWDVVINYGIKTGFNDAFIIPNNIKEQIIEEDLKSAEIIKPILRGKDIDAWFPEFEGYWLIGTFPSLKLNIDDYPAIKKFLLSHGIERLEQDGKGRKKTGNKWFETQDQISYWKNFEKPKIIFPNMTKYLPFVYDETGIYTNQKCFIMSGNYIKYLTCFFNSKLFKYCFSNNFPELQGGTKELSKVFFDKIPVKTTTAKEELPFSKIVDYLVALKKEKLENDIDKFILIYFEQIANALVFEWYFKEEFEKAGLSVAKHLEDLPDLNENEIVIHQLRKIYITVNQENHPIHQAVFSMLSIPQIELIMNNN